MTSSNILSAILAMDAYNRGSVFGVDLRDQTTLGFATLSESYFNGPEGFFAQSYILHDADGQPLQTIISFRGTDELFFKDSTHGYPLGSGDFHLSSHAKLAATFYQTIAATASPALIHLTGHSLGGGIAGFIAGLYGSSATLFDNMTFELSLHNFSLFQTIPGNLFIDPVFTSGPILPDPSVPPTNTYGFYVKGEVLEGVLPARALQNTPLTELSSFGGPRNPKDLHSIALLTTLLYASEKGLTDWHLIGRPLIDALSSDQVAIAAGLSAISGPDSPGAKLSQAIAYSALEEGGRPFGDQAIKAMFNDADDLGRLYAANVGNSMLANAGVRRALSEILVQYAGDLAKARSEDAEAGNQGIISVDNTTGKIIVDLDPAKWTATYGSGLHRIVGVADLIASLEASASTALFGAGLLPTDADFYN